MQGVTNRDRPAGFVAPRTPDPRNATNDRTPRRLVTPYRSRFPRTMSCDPSSAAAAREDALRGRPAGRAVIFRNLQVQPAAGGKSAWRSPIFHDRPALAVPCRRTRGPVGEKSAMGAPDRRDAAWWPGSPAGDARRQRRSVDVRGRGRDHPQHGLCRWPLQVTAPPPAPLPAPRAIGGSGAFPSRRSSRDRRHV